MDGKSRGIGGEYNWWNLWKEWKYIHNGNYCNICNNCNYWNIASILDTLFFLGEVNIVHMGAFCFAVAVAWRELAAPLLTRQTGGLATHTI